eukprot:TRINITY_DN2331_c0_g1_i3.p1 TRINITY_DN2331_c0_g1~~TRINITY_DN2331_c0_g1_i3.p1  ORF type:complete len:530 (+),score=141.21 TRINITY_DN2331_c0_g1_i3:81-1592(+)
MADQPPAADQGLRKLQSDASGQSGYTSTTPTTPGGPFSSSGTPGGPFSSSGVALQGVSPAEHYEFKDSDGARYVISRQYLGPFQKLAGGVVEAATQIGAKVAIKACTSQRRLSCSRELLLVARELRILRHFSRSGGHPNILELEAAHGDMLSTTPASERWLNIVTPRKNCTLGEMLKQKQWVEDFRADRGSPPKAHRVIERVMKQLVCGLCAMHSAHVAHRDLKPDNILVHESYAVCIGDFGLARDAAEPGAIVTKDVVTGWYRPPELWSQLQRQDGQLGPDAEPGFYMLPHTDSLCKVDIWSLGCVFAELLSDTNAILFNVKYDWQFFDWMGLRSSGEGHTRPRLDPWGILPGDAEGAPRPSVQYLKQMQHFDGGSNPCGPYFGRIAYGSRMADEQFDLLSQMLQFDPARRCTALEAWKSDYIQRAKIGSTLKQGPLDWPAFSQAHEEYLRGTEMEVCSRARKVIIQELAQFDPGLERSVGDEDRLPTAADGHPVVPPGTEA